MTLYCPHPPFLVHHNIVFKHCSSHGNLPKYPPGPAAPAKPFRSFAAFYQFYLSEHKDAENRFLHALGTSIAFFFILLRPRYLIGVLIGGSLGAPSPTASFRARRPRGSSTSAILLSASQEAYRYLVCLGYIASEITSAMSNGLAEMAVMMFSFVMVNYVLTRRSGLEVLLAGYGFAWVRDLLLLCLIF